MSREWRSLKKCSLAQALGRNLRHPFLRDLISGMTSCPTRRRQQPQLPVLDKMPPQLVLGMPVQQPPPPPPMLGGAADAAVVAAATTPPAGQGPATASSPPASGGPVARESVEGMSLGERERERESLRERERERERE
jgi:hypothetical protein